MISPKQYLFFLFFCNCWWQKNWVKFAEISNDPEMWPRKVLNFSHVCVNTLWLFVVINMKPCCIAIKSYQWKWTVKHEVQLFILIFTNQFITTSMLWLFYWCNGILVQGPSCGEKHVLILTRLVWFANYFYNQNLHW